LLAVGCGQSEDRKEESGMVSISLFKLRMLELPGPLAAKPLPLNQARVTGAT
jgi:hypothetical protein